MTKRNPHIAKLKSNYLFPEIRQRKTEFLKRQPGAQLISLGIGDTTEPLPPVITQALTSGAEKLGTRSGYIGYGPEHGFDELRQRIASEFYQGLVSHNEIFISDGAKCDIGRLQFLFGPDISIAVQDPAYPVYVDGSIMQGVKKISYMPCLPENHFFPDFKSIEAVDLIYFCSPNNPTGATATKAQLEELVAFAKAKSAIIIYDSAYAPFINDPSLPRSIYEIDGAREVALEISSFSKLAGFTGVRLGWTVVPEELRFEDGSSVKKDWGRIMSTVFNGASTISQKGGLGVLDPQGLKEAKEVVDFYCTNASILKQSLEGAGHKVYGGVHAPYLWVKFTGRESWEVFQEFLEKLHLVTTPGSGFGPSGEGFVRFTAFGSRENILEAARRIREGLANK